MDRKYEDVSVWEALWAFIVSVVWLLIAAVDLVGAYLLWFSKRFMWKVSQFFRKNDFR